MNEKLKTSALGTSSSLVTISELMNRTPTPPHFWTAECIAYFVGDHYAHVHVLNHERVAGADLEGRGAVEAGVGMVWGGRCS